MTKPIDDATCSSCGKVAPVALMCIDCMTLPGDVVVVPRAVLERAREALRYASHEVARAETFSDCIDALAALEGLLEVKP